MFRGIVLGEFWGIEEGVWVQLWSGAIGAVFSAAVAALVAALVLTHSNANQRALAQRQMAEQRAEASRAREYAAAADVLASVEWLNVVSRRSPEAVSAQVSVLLAAIARWRVEMGKAPMERELREWSVVLIGAAEKTVAAAGLGDAERESAGEHMTDVAAEVINVALQWPSASAENRVLMQRHLAKVRSELEGPRFNVPEGAPVP